jgi:4-amino-4-deoxy-L-arabinose transferase-like glycosyltransferase
MRPSSTPSHSTVLRALLAGVRSFAGSEAGALLLILAVTVLIRLPFLRWPLTGDEGNYAYTAYWWSRGQTLYANYLGLEKPQGIFLSYWLSQALLGLDTWAIRLWGAFWAAGSAITIYAIGKYFLDRKEAFLAALFFVILSAAPQVEGFTANAEVFMLLPLALGALALWKNRPFQAGVWMSVGFLFKLSAVCGFVFVLLWLIYRRAPRQAWLRFALGAALPLMAGLLHGALTVGLGAYLYNIALFRIGVGWQYVASLTDSFQAHWLQTAAVWLPLGVLAFFGLGRFAAPQRVFLLAWITTSLLGTAMGGDWNLHYFIQLIPALCIPAAAGLVIILRAENRPLRWAALGLVALCAVWLLPAYAKQPREGSWDLYHRAGVQAGDEVGAYLQAHTDETDSIYVAYFQANIYYQARRQAAVPYLSRVQLLFVPGAYDQLVGAIQARMPAYVIIVGQFLDNYDEGRQFLDALAAGYRVETTLDGVLLYRRTGK